MKAPEQQDPITVGTAQQMTQSCIQKDKAPLQHKTESKHMEAETEDDVIRDQRLHQHGDDPALQEEEGEQ
jgi:hypothetical protein